MTFLSALYLRLYYFFGSCIFRKIKIDLPERLKETKNIFIYFDYEREFSGHATSISDEDVGNILDELESVGIKTTWFVVGKIFTNYQHSIKQILDLNHELGSHTFHHISPRTSPSVALHKDFHLFNESTIKKYNINGFHSPKGQWSIKMMRSIKRYNFLYDLVGTKNKNKLKPFYIKWSKFRLLRFVTLGDDWLFYKKPMNDEQVYHNLKKLCSHINHGDVAGIGFHPWILVSDTNIFEGFKKFLKYLKESEEYSFNTAINFANQINNSNK